MALSVWLGIRMTSTACLNTEPPSTRPHSRLPNQNLQGKLQASVLLQNFPQGFEWYFSLYFCIIWISHIENETFFFQNNVNESVWCVCAYVAISQAYQVFWCVTRFQTCWCCSIYSRLLLPKLWPTTSIKPFNENLRSSIYPDKGDQRKRKDLQKKWIKVQFKIQERTQTLKSKSPGFESAPCHCSWLNILDKSLNCPEPCFSS